MTEQYLKTLTDVYNTVRTIPVQGDHVVSMVNVMSNLEKVIRIMANELRSQQSSHTKEDNPK